MRKFLLATHSTLAAGAKNALELIIGQQDNLDTLCAYTQDDFDLREAILGKLSALAKTDELIVVTDAFGGSVNNAFMPLLEDERIHLVTGMNLTLLIDLLSAPENMPVRELIQNAVIGAREGIMRCSAPGEESGVPEEDF